MWKMKKPPRFHQVDFLEVVEVMAQWAGYLVTQYFLDPANNVALAFGENQSVQAGNMTCPITFQEFSLILRNELMVLFGDTQAGVQGLSVEDPGGGYGSFSPLMAGSTTCGITSSQMKMPIGIIENLRSLSVHTAFNKKNKDPVVFYPVLGTYYQSTLNASDYTYSFFNGDAEATLPIFSLVPPVEYAKVTTKGVEWTKLAIETPISLIDGFDGSHYVFINDQNRLKTLTTFWNEWVSQFSAYSSPIGTLSRDGGVNVLCSINQTRYLQNGVFAKNKLGVEKNPRPVSPKVVGPRDVRLEKRRYLSDSPYMAFETYAISSQVEPFAATLAITAGWILPTIFLYGTAEQSITFERLQKVNDEPYSVIFSATGDTGLPLATTHAVFAQSMVKARDAPDTPFDSELKALSSVGHAGVLSEMVGQFISKGLTSIAEMLPI